MLAARPCPPGYRPVSMLTTLVACHRWEYGMMVFERDSVDGESRQVWHPLCGHLGRLESVEPDDQDRSHVVSNLGAWVATSSPGFGGRRRNTGGIEC